jgi:glycerol-3-phosphate dehydrogenase
MEGRMPYEHEPTDRSGARRRTLDVPGGADDAVASTPPTFATASTAPEVADVLVIGAGVLGAGVAQALAARGHAVVLLERRVPATGTSSRSSKLIHGGLRYLETGQLRLVRESLVERAILLRIAPHLVRLVPFHVPVYVGMRRGRWLLRAGLSLYAVLGGLGRDTRFESVPSRTWDELDGLRTDGLRAVFRYLDGQTDDAALCRAVVASARDLGAHVRVDAEVVRAERAGDLWRVHWREAGAERSLLVRAVVNAAGAWANGVNSRATPRPPSREVDLVSGVHIELEGRLAHGVYYTEAPSDGRAVFSIPWKGRILVGTTETLYTGDPGAVTPTAAELEYLEAVHRHHFPSSAGAVVASWAGLRVLPRAETRAFRRPREVLVVSDEEHRPTWSTVYGGKLTGYRHTGHRVAELVGRSLPPARRRADTATLRLPELERVTVWEP